MIGGVAVVAIIIGGFVFVYGGQNFSGTPFSEATGNVPVAIAVPFTELAHGTQSDVSTRTNYLITSMSELDKLWEMVNATSTPPTVDFSSNYVAAVFAGQRMTGGYAIAVSKVADTQNRLVTITITSPDSSCMVTQSTTAPYQIVEIPKTSLPFTHEDQTSTTSCSQ